VRVSTNNLETHNELVRFGEVADDTDAAFLLGEQG
jgi:ribosomal protein L35AE/L33A